MDYPAFVYRWAEAARQSMRVDLLRQNIAYTRFLYFTRARRALRTMDGDTAVAENTVSHNLKGMHDQAVVRSLALIRPLSVIETLNRDSRILAIGPRTEGELLNLVANGFRKSNIRGLDLISYSPWVDLGDMHAMPYAESSWDAVLMGWVIAYSNDPARAAREVVRVTKPGGVVAVGVEYSPETNDEAWARIGYKIGIKDRIVSVKQILEFFGDHVDYVYFSHDIQPSRRDKVGAICAVFSIKK